jgi:hypothetical protein
MSLDKIVSIISVVAAVFAAYLYLDAAHFGAEEAASQYLEVQEELLTIDRGRNEAIRNFYENKQAAEGSLTEYEQRRYEGILRQLDRQEQKQLIIENKK